MIGRLKGVLLEKHLPDLLIDVKGVGYELQAPMTTFYTLPERGEEIILYTHFIVREDTQQLYGFAKLAERALFRLLIKVNGVGPKLALAILSNFEPDGFVHCIANNDENMLVRIPGVGRKTAQRLILDMKDKVKDWYAGDLNERTFTTSSTVSNVSGKSNQSQEAISALIALGYKPQEASQAVNKIMKDDLTAEQMIRLALQCFI